MSDCQKHKTNPSIYLYPLPAMSHIVPMCELGKLLLQHNFSVTMIIIQPPKQNSQCIPDSVTSFISQASSSNPCISFHYLPSHFSCSWPPPPEQEAYMFDLFHHSNPSLLQYLKTVSSPPSALVFDFFCIDALDVCDLLNIPGYLFWVSGIYTLSSFINFPKIHDSSLSLRDMGSERIEIGQGIPLLPANHFFPAFLLNKQSATYNCYLNGCTRILEVKGVIANTIDQAMEKKDTIKEFRRPIYCVGPLVNMDINKSNEADCMAWLDKQPKHSVVFLCFGSLGMFSDEQMKEIATGLERSKQRFLWVARSDICIDLEERLPEGFLDNTREVGMVVKSWVPQAAILRHESIGGFVTHCGWNSVLEAIGGGVPMIGWPLYGDERCILVYLVEGLKVAVEMKGYEKGFVSAEEVEMKVKWLMKSEGGRELRERVIMVREEGKYAWEKCGSSSLALSELVEELKKVNAA